MHPFIVIFYEFGLIWQDRQFPWTTERRKPIYLKLSVSESESLSTYNAVRTVTSAYNAVRTVTSAYNAVRTLTSAYNAVRSVTSVSGLMTRMCTIVEWEGGLNINSKQQESGRTIIVCILFVSCYFLVISLFTRDTSGSTRQDRRGLNNTHYGIIGMALTCRGLGNARSCRSRRPLPLPAARHHRPSILPARSHVAAVNEPFLVFDRSNPVPVSFSNSVLIHVLSRKYVPVPVPIAVPKKRAPKK